MSGGATTSLPSAVLALLAVVAVILLGQRAARRLAGRWPAAPGRAGRRLAVEETLALDPRRRVHLLRCDGRRVLLLTGGAGGDAVIGWLGESDAP